jgi:opacity protein-like surface antigen
MKKILILITLSIFSTVLFAGDISRKGSTGADQLLVPVGARGIATGSALHSSLYGLESIYYNPAGLDMVRGTEAMFSYMTYLADINMSYFAISSVLGDLGSFALSFKTFDFGDIPVTTNDFPDGTGKTYSPSFLTIGLTYSKVITDRISVGTNFKLVSETIENTSATGLAVDVGVQYRFNSELSLAAVVKNIGTNMVYSGSDLQQRTTVPNTVLGSPNGTFEIVAEPFQIPSFFELGLTYKYGIDEQNNILMGSTFTANNALEDKMNFGLEYSYMNTFFLRGGYNLLMENNDQSVYGFTAGAGVDYKLADDIGVVFDYAFRAVQDFPTANHVLTMKLAFK